MNFSSLKVFFPAALTGKRCWLSVGSGHSISHAGRYRLISLLFLFRLLPYASVNDLWSRDCPFDFFCLVFFSASHTVVFKLAHLAAVSWHKTDQIWSVYGEGFPVLKMWQMKEFREFSCSIPCSRALTYLTILVQLFVRPMLRNAIGDIPGF